MLVRLHGFNCSEVSRRHNLTADSLMFWLLPSFHSVLRSDSCAGAGVCCGWLATGDRTYDLVLIFDRLWVSIIVLLLLPFFLCVSF